MIIHFAKFNLALKNDSWLKALFLFTFKFYEQIKHSPLETQKMGLESI